MMKTILITGADGFLGKKLVIRFLEMGHKVIAASRSPENLKTNTDKNKVSIKFNLENGVDDLNDIEDKIDVICHTAAFIPKDFNDSSKAEYCYKINSLGTQKVLDFAKSSAVDHFIYYTSGNAYEYSEKPVNENANLYPSQKATYYLGSKLLGELYVDHYRQKGLLNTTIFRLSSVYGNGMKESEFVIQSIEKLLNSEEIIIYNDDIYKTDFVFVEDIIQATVLSIDNGNYGIFNIGSGVRTSLGQVGKILARLLNKSEELIRILPVTDIGKVAKGFSALDMEKTEAVIGITPTSLEVGLKELIEEIDI